MQSKPDSAGTPRWVKVLALVAVVVIALVAVTVLASGGDHGPGRHASSGGVTLR